ncbi:MAG TPA: ATP-NAD kinase [Tissierella sp.]|uniref:ATP-NAD kinase family protein n=1 Tax=Tissierella praeacuta TaxID=43131 RepID=UPI000ED6B74A|nr:ATP-NAD kinase family protein [Tissierella praeacuta]HAE92684.1 ATP-NAD kinase [Tissierella sp.]
MKTIGLIINPVSGMGGKVGLKGTDGREILDKAIKLGAVKEAPSKAVKALKKLEPIKEELLILTSSFDMGENQCKLLGFDYEIIHKSTQETNALDTIKAAKLMEKRGVELIIFVGGDGTARNIYEAINNRVVVLGIPAGVKIHSPVYGNTPESAGELALLYLKGDNLNVKEEEVIDIDEEAFRNDIVRTQLFGYFKIPYKKELLQNKKAPTPLIEEASQKAIALDIIDNMEEEIYYIIGPGTTTRAIMEALNLPSTLLGVDIVKDKKIIKLDCNEEDILNILADKKGRLIITPTGGQGYLLGRGNQQISPKVLKIIGKDNILIISPNSKIVDLRGNPLLIYTGDETTDKKLAGYYRIKVGYKMDIIYKVSGVY